MIKKEKKKLELKFISLLSFLFFFSFFITHLQYLVNHNTVRITDHQKNNTIRIPLGAKKSQRHERWEIKLMQRNSAE